MLRILIGSQKPLIWGDTVTPWQVAKDFGGRKIGSNEQKASSVLLLSLKFLLRGQVV